MSQSGVAAKVGKFISYPANCVAGVVDDGSVAAQVIANLAGASFGDGISTFQGPEGAANIDASGAQHGLFARVVRIVQFTTMDGAHAQRYEDEAGAGHTVIIVHVEGHEDAQHVRRILKDGGGHFINWYGRLHFEVLDD